MSFTFAMFYKPAYQKRYGKCACCKQGIEAGEQIMVGTGYFNGCLVRNHNHYACWFEAIQARAREWFFANDYVPKRMSVEQKAELNRLRAKRYYIQQKGGEPNEIAELVKELDKRMALVKAKT